MSAFIDSGHDRGWWLWLVCPTLRQTSCDTVIGRKLVLPRFGGLLQTVISSSAFSARFHPPATTAFTAIRKYTSVEFQIDQGRQRTETERIFRR
jgi:hypothetical protein